MMRCSIALLAGPACLALAAAAAVFAGKAGGSEDVVKRYVDLWNTGNMTTAAEILSPDVVRIGPDAANTSYGLADLIRHVAQVRDDYDDFKVSIRKLEAEGDRAVLSWNVRGTYAGAMFPEASGRKVKAEGTSILRIDAGRIALERTSWDVLAVSEQLGIEGPLSAPADNVALTKRYLTEMYEKGNVDVAYELVDAEHVLHAPAAGGEVRGPVAVQKRALRFHTAFPDMRFQFNEILAADDLVAAQWTFTGTHKGTFLGVEPTGRTVAIDGLSLSRIRDGKIVESWGFWDTAQLPRSSAPGRVR